MTNFINSNQATQNNKNTYQLTLITYNTKFILFKFLMINFNMIR